MYNKIYLILIFLSYSPEKKFVKQKRIRKYLPCKCPLWLQETAAKTCNCLFPPLFSFTHH